VEDVAGYRVLRSAGHGDRARLLLGFDEGRTVVLKVCPVADPSRHVEAEALSRAAGDHVVGLEDAASDDRDAVLVLERLPGGTLAELLDRRGTLEVGEAVTILAPLAATLDRIHVAGVAHGGLSLAAVCFREDGAPTLIGFGTAELFAPGSPEVVRETVAGVLDDREALRGVAALVLARVAGERAPAAHRLAVRLGEFAPDRLGSALFDLATPAPIRFDADVAETPAVRVGELVEVAVADEAPHAVLPPWLLALIPDGLRDRILEPLGRLREVWSGWQPGRRRLALGVAAGGVTVLAAVALVPVAPADPSVAQPTPGATSPVEAVPDLPDDPVEAAILLLALRERCVRDLAVLCLDDVAQAGSAAYDDDVAIIRSVEGGGEYPDAIANGDPVLVERLGDSALLDLPVGSAPASILLLRTTDGWRIRQYLSNQDLDAPAG
jgi:hypothetical protein